MTKRIRQNSKDMLKITGFFLAALWLSGCAIVEQTLEEFKKPTASINAVSLADMTLDAVTLLFDLSVNNPNAVALRSDGLDYSLNVSEQPLVSIDRSKRAIDLPANGRGQLQIPVTFNFQDLYQVASSLRGRNEIAYDMQLGVYFDLPLIGEFRVPVSYASTVPIPQLPTVNFVGVNVEQLSLSGARILLDLDVQNGNSFGIDMNQLQYQINANGTTLGRGEIASLEMPENNRTRLSMPLELRFNELGATLYRLLSGNDPVNIGFNGDVELLPQIEAWRPGDMGINLIRQLGK